MPARRQTRTQERAVRIGRKRGINQARLAADPPPAYSGQPLALSLYFTLRSLQKSAAVPASKM